MFKDYEKYLSASLKVYIFVLMIIFILKLVGLDYFGLNISNPTLIKISNYLSSTHWGDLYYFTSLCIQFYFYLGLVTNKTKLYRETFASIAIFYSIQCLLAVFYEINWLYSILCFLLFMIVPAIVNKRIQIKRPIKYILIMLLYQYISLFVRNVGIGGNYYNFLVDSLLNIDQLLLLAITYNIHFMKGGIRLCGEEQAAFSSLLKKRNYLTLLKNLQANYSNFKKYSKQDKATIVIYTILSSIWNIFTLIVVLFMAKINDTFIECIFIITSFWLSKKVFGKPFHLKSMMGCFILSNATYYVLNRITTPIGISIVIPVMLGVGLSYVTSKFVKKIKPLYKGMPEDEFNYSILEVIEKNSDKYNICYDFFIKKENAISLGYKYNYTEAGIRKIIYRVNEKIKALK